MNKNEKHKFQSREIKKTKFEKTEVEGKKKW